MTIRQVRCGGLALAPFLDSSAQCKSYKWKMSQGIAEDHPAAARSKQFAKIVSDKSGGRINITYFPLLVCLLFLCHSAKYCLWIYGSGEKTPGLWWPRIYSVGSMLFGAFFMTIYSFANLIRHSNAAIRGVKITPGGVL